MKKINVSLILFSAIAMFASGMLLTGCQKEDELTNVGNEISDSKSEWLGEFKRDLCVYDGSGENSAYFAVYSDDEIALEEFISNNSFTLGLEIEVALQKHEDFTAFE